MPAATEEITVSRNDEAGRYEIHVGEALAGFTQFSTDARGRLRFPHTEVDPAFRGQGIAQTLLAEAMADEARRGDEIVPLCPLVAQYLRDNEVPGLKIAWPAPRPGAN